MRYERLGKTVIINNFGLFFILDFIIRLYFSDFIFQTFFFSDFIQIQFIYFYICEFSSPNPESTPQLPVHQNNSP